MKLDPGIYKIQRRDNYDAYGKKHPRQNNNSIHILRVEKRRGENELLCYVDHSLQSDPVEAFEDYDIISKFSGVPQISKCRITISFEDSAGTNYAWSMHDVWVLRNLFDAIDWLKKPFGYEKRGMRN